MFKRFCFCVASSALLSGCNTPAGVVSQGGHFVDVGTTSFAVFAQQNTVTAICLTNRPSDFKAFAQMAIKAISYATKCGIADGSLHTDGKSVFAVLDCVKYKMAHLRTAQTSRRLSAQNLPELSGQDLAYLRETEGDVSELGHP